jgi:hypothetical protein
MAAEMFGWATLLVVLTGNSSVNGTPAALKRRAEIPLLVSG